MKKIISVVVAISVVCFLLFLCGGRSAEKTTKQALKAMHEGNASKYVSLMYDDVVEYQMESNDVKTKKLFVKEYEKAFDSIQSKMVDKYGKKWKYKIEIIDSYDSEAPESMEIDSLSGKNFKEVAYEVTYTGKGFLKEKEGTDEGTFLLVEKKNKWYIVDFN